MSTDDSIRPAGSIQPTPLDGATRSAADQPLPPPDAARVALQQSAFLARARQLLQLHNDLGKGYGKPPMWGALQALALIIAVVVAYSVYDALIKAQPEQQSWAGAAFLATFLIVLLAPDVLLKLVHRSRKSLIRQNLLDAIAQTMRTYPEEVARSGGPGVLVDRVELEALITVLQEQGLPEGAKQDEK